MSGRVLLLCAGEQTRWKAPAPKQLTRVTNNEILIARTVRQCRTRFSGEDPLLISHHAALRSYSKHAIYPQKRRYITETLYSSHSLWGENWTIVLLGDVFYSNKVIDAIVSNRDKCEYRFYGTASEIYALTYTDKSFIALHLASVVELADRDIGRGKLWDLYYSTIMLPLVDSGGGRIQLEEDYDKEHFVTVKDSTSDFDTIESYSKWYKENSRDTRS